jgi:hypothetical protein
LQPLTNTMQSHDFLEPSQPDPSQTVFLLQTSRDLRQIRSLILLYYQNGQRESPCPWRLSAGMEDRQARLQPWGVRQRFGLKAGDSYDA